MSDSAAFSESDNLDNQDVVEEAATAPVEKPAVETAPVEMANEAGDEPGGFHEDREAPAPIIIGKQESKRPLADPIVHSAAQSKIGQRPRNEDACFIFSAEAGGHFKLPLFGLYVIADGMGGHANGHIASKIASRVAAQHILNRLYLPLLTKDGLSNQTPVQEVMETAERVRETFVSLIGALVGEVLGP